MTFPIPGQTIQDLLTQQWVILLGRKIIPEDHSWLIGPFGEVGKTGLGHILQFAAKEDLLVERGRKDAGLIPSMARLKLPEKDNCNLSTGVVDFYEHTSNYDLDFKVSWNPFFKIFGFLINKLFSNRIDQLNIPTSNMKNDEQLKSEIIDLIDPETKMVKYTFWYRSIPSSGQVVYSGVYSICTLPSGQTCVKAVFPLPNGNATVVMKPGVNEQGVLTLDSSGSRFGDAGFYFLLKDKKGNYHARFIRSFRDKLTIAADDRSLFAEQTLTLWWLRVLKFRYSIHQKERP